MDNKGKLGGNCNVTRCQRDGSAFYYNISNKKYYCRSCALKINEACIQYGEPLIFNIEFGDKLYNLQRN